VAGDELLHGGEHSEDSVCVCVCTQHEVMTR
jgi:hypothetical protein